MSVPLDLVAWLVQERYLISLFYAIRQNWLLTNLRPLHIIPLQLCVPVIPTLLLRHTSTDFNSSAKNPFILLIISSFCPR